MYSQSVNDISKCNIPFDQTKRIPSYSTSSDNGHFSSSNRIILRDTKNDFKISKNQSKVSIPCNVIDAIIINCNDIRNSIEIAAAIRMNEIQSYKISLLDTLNTYERERIQKLRTKEKEECCIKSSKHSLKRGSAGLSNKDSFDDDVSKDEILQFISNTEQIDQNFLGRFQLHSINESLVYNLSSFKKISLSKLFNHDSQANIDEFETQNENYFTIYRNQEYVSKFLYSNQGANETIEVNSPKTVTFINFKQRNDFIVLNYIHEPSQDYYIKLMKIKNKNEKAPAIGANDIGCTNLILIGADDLNIFCTSTTGLHVFDWNLNLLKSFEVNHTSLSFNFGNNIKQIEEKNKKYIWINESALNITDVLSGIIIHTIKLKADKFVLDSNDSIVVFSQSSQKLWYISMDGHIKLKCKLVDFPAIISSFYLDKNDRYSFLDRSNMELYILIEN